MALASDGHGVSWPFPALAGAAGSPAMIELQRIAKLERKIGQADHGFFGFVAWMVFFGRWACARAMWGKRLAQEIQGPTAAA